MSIEGELQRLLESMRRDPGGLSDVELEMALTVAARRRSVFDGGRFERLLAERDRRRDLYEPLPATS